MAKRLKRENIDIIGGKCIRNDNGKLTLSVDEKLGAWQSHYDKLFNRSFLGIPNL